MNSTGRMVKKKLKAVMDSDFESCASRNYDLSLIPKKRKYPRLKAGRTSYLCRHGCQKTFRNVQLRLKHEKSVHLKINQTGKWSFNWRFEKFSTTHFIFLCKARCLIMQLVEFHNIQN